MGESQNELNPFPGLRPFEENEDYLFFGREHHIDMLLQRLKKRFLAVVGVSGSGKSSLVKAGLFPALRGGFFMGKAGSSWRITLIQPGRDPFGKLAAALNQPEIFGSSQTDKEEAAIRNAITEDTLRRSTLGLLEVIREADMESDDNLLIVVDQFEELFRFKETAGVGFLDDDAAAFVRLLLEAAKDESLNIFILITMRSDFLGDCARFRDLPEAINAGQHLIPRMTREMQRRAIEGPAAVGGANMTPRLIRNLLNDVGDHPAQLPILQHALMRTWEYWRNSGDKQPDLPHYKAIGGMDKGLSRHADEIYQDLPDRRSREITEKLFKNITVMGRDNRGVRRPVRLDELRKAISAGKDELETVLEIFRRPGCSFLAPRGGVDLEDYSMVDLSHESLMRIWDQLKEWVEEEAKSAQMYRRIAEVAVLHKNKEAGLWRDPNDPQLQLALDWRKRSDPNEAWAARYHPSYDLAMNFLTKSLCERNQEIKKIEAENQRELTNARSLTLNQARMIMLQEEAAIRQKWFFYAVIVGLLIAIVLGTVAYVQYIGAENARVEAHVQKIIAIEQAEDSENAEAEAKRQKMIAIEQAKVSRSHELAAFAIKELKYDPTLSFRLAEAALETKNTLLARSAIFASFEHPLYNDLEGHTGMVFCAAFSPEGGSFVTAGDDNTARIWDVEAGEELLVLQGHEKPVVFAAFLPDGRRIVTASWDGEARIWDAVAGKEISVMKGHVNAITFVAVSPDGRRILTASRDGEARIWDPDAGQLLHVWKSPDETLLSAVFSPQGDRVVTAHENNSLRIRDAGEGGELHLLKGHKNPVDRAMFSPDGKRIVSIAIDGEARIWDADAGETLHVLNGRDGDDARAAPSWDDVAREELRGWVRPDQHINSATFSPDGRLVVTASRDGAARIWSADTGEELRVLTGHEDEVTFAAFSPDGSRIVTTSKDAAARIWDASQGDELCVFKGNRGAVSTAAFSPDGRRVVTVSVDGALLLWDAAIDMDLQVFKGHKGDVTFSAFSPDGRRVVTSSWDHTARIWDADTGMELHVLKGHVNVVQKAVFSPDGRRVLTHSWDRTARIWSADTGKELYTLKAGNAPIIPTFSPDGARIITVQGDEKAILWDVNSGEISLYLEGHDGKVTSGGFSPDGARVVTASLDHTARIWDARAGAALHILKGHEAGIRDAVFSRDGSRIVTASYDKTARIWDADAGRELHVLKGHEGSLRGAAFSHDNQLIATTSEDEVRIWDAVTGEEKCGLKEYWSKINGAVFPPNGCRVVVTASDNGNMRIRDVRTGKDVHILKGYGKFVYDSMISPDGARIVIPSRDYTARILAVSHQGVLNAVNVEKIHGTVEQLSQEERIEFGFVR